MKVWAYLALAALLIGAATSYTVWIYGLGQRDERAKHDQAQARATAAVVVQADGQARVDERIGVEATESVQGRRDASQRRLDRIAVAPLVPPPSTGGPDASAAACPDVLGPAFWRLYRGQAVDDPAPAPASGSPVGVPSGG